MFGNMECKYFAKFTANHIVVSSNGGSDLFFRGATGSGNRIGSYT